MSLKLKLNLNGNKDLKKNGDQSTPIIKIKPPTLKREESVGSVVKPPKPSKEVKKLKISLSRAPSAAVLDSSKSSSTPKTAPPSIPKRVPKLRIKPTRIPGEGYDSEAPDVEDDPLIEQGIAIRFLNDANLDFVHGAVGRGDLSNINIKWITRDKAVVNVNLTLYLARLIDLPTITELYKTVDKKNIFKTIDISQILLVLRTINPKQLNMETDFEVPEEHTYTHPLYTLSVNNEIKATKTVFKHGLLASLEDVYRRFRPRKTNHRLMTDIELRVDELVRRDTEAEESHYEYVNPKKQAQKFASDGSRPQLNVSLSRPDVTSDRMMVDPRASGTATEEQTDDGEDQEELQDQLDQDLEADLDNVLERELADALDSTSNIAAATVLMKSEYDNEDEVEADADEGNADDDDDEDDDDDDDEDENDEDDEDPGKEDDSRAKKLEEEIAELLKATEKQKVLLATASYKMMRMKFQSNYNHLKSQLDQKKRELSKVREQQQKQQSLNNPQHIGLHTAPQEEDDDEEEDDEDEEEDDDEQIQQDENDMDIDAVANAGNVNEHGIDGDGDGDGEKGDDFDDFQGLF